MLYNFFSGKNAYSHNERAGDNMTDTNDPIFKKITAEIIEICSPFQVFLVSCKRNSSGKLTTFKICAVVEDKYDEQKLESEILIKTDCPIPCDVIIYRVSEWNELLDDDCTFASRIDNEGAILYEQKQQP